MAQSTPGDRLREDARRPLVNDGSSVPAEPSSADNAVPLPSQTLADDSAATQQVTPPVPFKALFRYATGAEVPLLMVATMFAFASGLSGPAISFFMKDLAEVIFADKEERQEKVLKLFIMFVAIGAASWIATSVAVLIFTRIADKMAVRMRTSFFAHLLQKDVGWYDSNSSAEMTTRLTQDAYDYRQGCGSKLALFLQSIVQAPLGVAVAFTRDWQFTLLLIGVLPVISIVMGVSMRLAIKKMASQSESYAKAGGIAETAIGSIQTVAAFGGYGREIAKYDAKLREAERDGVRAGNTEGMASGITATVFNAVFALGLWAGSWLMLKSYHDVCWDVHTGNVDGCFNGSVMVSCLFAVFTGGFAMAPAFQQLGVVNQARVAAARMYRIIDQPAAFDASVGFELQEIRGEVVFQDVRFTYPTRTETPALDNVSFKVEAGTTAAFVGPSGSGKSTSIALLMRYYDPAAGSVSLDGCNIKTLNLHSMRSKFALVQQEPVLFTGTILSNILHGKAGASKEEAIAAARAANAHGFVSAMEQGYDTPVGERGATLSGGQKQRIAIARAMIRNPKVLLLDEATSALDTESERVVMEALDAIVAERKRTTLVIAHRLSTIKNSDVIFVLENGKLVEQGTHKELLAKDGGLYQQLVRLQELSHEDDSEKLYRQLSGASGAQAGAGALQRQGSVVSRQASGPTSPLRLARSLSDRSGASAGEDIRRVLSNDFMQGVASSQPDGDPAQAGESGKSADLPDEDERDNDVPASRLFELQKGRMAWFSVAMCMTVTRSAAGPLIGYLFGHSIDILSAPPAVPVNGIWVPAYNEDDINNAVKNTAITYSILSAIQFTSILLSDSGFRRVSENLTRNVRLNTFSAMMRQEMAYFDLRTSGQLTDRLAHEAAMIKSFTGESFGGAARVVATLGVALGLALWESWKLTGTIMIIMPFLMAGQVFHMTSLKKKDETRAGPVVSEVIGNIRTVAAFGLQDRMRSWYEEVLRQEFGEDRRQGTVSGVMQGYNAFFQWMLYGTVMLVASFYIDHAGLNPKSVFQVFFTLVFAMGGVSQGITQWQGDKAKGAHAVKHIFNTLDRKPLIDAYEEGGLKLDEVKGAVAFKKVHFSYPSQPLVTVFSDFDLSIEAGQNVAFVGPSGSGKSTTVRLLQRFYDPAVGSITLDGHDLRSLNLQWLRSQMSLVQQEPILFAGSVLDNIKYGREGAADEEAMAAARDANAHNFIAAFDSGYQTEVGERGAQLSGGQKQRVAIARCMVRRPKVLLLDEATSALDTESERLVQQALDSLLAKEKRTTLVIAHRLSTIQNSDLICVVYQGRVVEKGKHQELMKIPDGHYKQLAARQQL